jgi:hypothetical protein
MRIADAFTLVATSSNLSQKKVPNSKVSAKNEAVIKVLKFETQII